MTTPLEILERLQALPEHLQAHHRRFIVEATSDDTRSPFIEFYRRTDEANTAAQTWAKDHGADGFYPPNQSWGHDDRDVRVFSFKAVNAPGAPAWTKAGRGYVTDHGHIPVHPSKRPQGKALAAELASLPKFPSYDSAISHLQLVTDLRTSQTGCSVGHSDGKLHYSVPCRIGDRFFVSAVNHNYDIGQAAESAAEYLSGDHPEWASSLDYKGDPIAWRPGDGWTFLTDSEFKFLIADARLSEERRRAA